MDSGVSEFILLTSLSVCAAADVKEGRIPNGCLAIGGGLVFVSILWEAWERGGPASALLEAVWFLARLVFTGILGFPLFALRMTGAGDVKLASVMTAALGVGRGAASIVTGLCLGAVLALVKMLRYGSVCGRFCHLLAYVGRMIHNKKPEAYYLRDRDGAECVIPLGACLWAGALITVLWME